MKEAGFVETDKDHDKMMTIAKVAMLYDLRLMITHGEKETYTKEEIAKLLDTVADKIERE